MITKFVRGVNILKLTRLSGENQVVFFSRVGKCTICSKPWSFVMSINIYPSD